MKNKIMGLFKGNEQKQHMERIPIDDLLKILSNAKTDGAKYVSIDKMDISYFPYEKEVKNKKIRRTKTCKSEPCDMENKYKEYLKINQKKPDVIEQYAYEINKVCEIEGYTWKQLAENIDHILPMYKTGGIKEDLGNYSHGKTKAALGNLKKMICNF